MSLLAERGEKLKARLTKDCLPLFLERVRERLEMVRAFVDEEVYLLSSGRFFQYHCDRDSIHCLRTSIAISGGSPQR